MEKPSKEELLNQIENLRGKLYTEASESKHKKDLTGDNLLSISKDLDELIVKYMSKRYKTN